MHAQVEKSKAAGAKAVGGSTSVDQTGGEPVFQFADSRPGTVLQRKLQQVANNSRQTRQTAQFRAMADRYTARQRQAVWHTGDMGLIQFKGVGGTKIAFEYGEVDESHRDKIVEGRKKAGFH